LRNHFPSQPDYDDTEGSGGNYNYPYYYDNYHYPVDDEDANYVSGSGSGESKCQDFIWYISIQPVTVVIVTVIAVLL